MPNQAATIRIALAQVNSIVGDFKANARKVVSLARQAQAQGVDIVSFPELVITGYPPEDLLLKPKFVKDNLKVLGEAAKQIGDIVAVAGFVDRRGEDIYNAAAVIHQGRIKGVYHKVFLPNYGVFDEKRYFASGKDFPVFGVGAVTFGVNICEDIWHLEGPAGIQAYRGARFIININASPYHMGKGRLREQILKAQSRKNKVFISYVNLVGGQDELVFDGQSVVVDDKGKVIARAQGFSEQLLITDIAVPASRRKKRVFLRDTGTDKPFIKPAPLQPYKDETREVYQALVLGLRDYILKNGFKKVVLGLSGGIDSSLVAALSVDAIGKENVVGVSLPTVYTSEASREDALLLARNLGIEFMTVPIQGIFEKYLDILKDVFSGRPADVTEENLQARIRGNIIMALSNKFGYLALNTGNKSEVSCGYCTLYGDMAGGFGVLKDVPKTLVYKLCAGVNKKENSEVIPQRVFDKPPSAELRPDQKDSDSLPEYAVLDRVLKQYVEEDKSLSDIVRSGVSGDMAAKVTRLVDLAEYKRRQSPPGIKITPKAFGRDRRIPITNHYR